jgi:hypothetical protein
MFYRGLILVTCLGIAGCSGDPIYKTAKLPGGLTQLAVTMPSASLGAPPTTSVYLVNKKGTVINTNGTLGGQDPALALLTAATGGFATGLSVGASGKIFSVGTSGANGVGKIVNIDKVTVQGATATVTH